MGNDLSVVRAARVSFANDPEVVLEKHCPHCGTGEDEDGNPSCWLYDDVCQSGEHMSYSLSARDQKLIAYLAKHNHWTPFAHTSITLRVSAPVPIRTQCFKHKQGFVENEESRRYIKSTPKLFIPEYFREAPPEGGAKQGSGGQHIKSNYYRTQYEEFCLDSIALFERMIEDGVCPEQARFVLPQGCLVNWYWTGSLAAYARFYKQRTDSHAQKEIQDLAKVIGGIIGPLYPVSWKELTK
jgi:thymidylate synthase (FAD)